VLNTLLKSQNCIDKSGNFWRWRFCFRWAVLSDVASEVTLIQKKRIRGALDSVEKVQELKNLGKIRLITPAESKRNLGTNKSNWLHKKDGEDALL
jgi:thioredoxin reductase (NADPH)